MGEHPLSLSQEDDHRGHVAGNVPMEFTGADLRDRVIEQLSAVRLTLRSVEGALSGGPLAGRLWHSIAELDHATEQLRGAERPDSQVAPTGDAGLTGRLLQVVIEASPLLDSAPGLHFSGMNVPLPRDVEADLRAMLRRALTDVGQRTTTDVDVRVVATADRLTAQVTEYGTGTASSRVGQGDVDSRAPGLRRRIFPRAAAAREPDSASRPPGARPWPKPTELL